MLHSSYGNLSNDHNSTIRHTIIPVISENSIATQLYTDAQQFHNTQQFSTSHSHTTLPHNCAPHVHNYYHTTTFPPLRHTSEPHCYTTTLHIAQLLSTIHNYTTTQPSPTLPHNGHTTTLPHYYCCTTTLTHNCSLNHTTALHTTTQPHPTLLPPTPPHIYFPYPTQLLPTLTHNCAPSHSIYTPQPGSEE